ncbi:MAG TPA: heat-inducible transcriptional repressor HrcA [Chlamydiales bacterium]|nr:heat-inducible transcriptional repressor HrcA [Chlamydiales bacterium]
MKKKKPLYVQKEDKIHKVLFGLIELFILTNKPIGSNALKSNGFDYLSSATIRNYFAKLEKEDLLIQQHTSGGRIPTAKAYRIYANAHQDTFSLSKNEKKQIEQLIKQETKQISTFLQTAANLLSETLNLPIFYSTPLFDNDFVQNIKIVPLEPQKLLCIIITDFGQIYTEQILSPISISPKESETIEQFFLWRIGKRIKPLMKDNIYKLSTRFYNEIMLKHIVNAPNMNPIQKNGLSKLLNYDEFTDPIEFGNALSILENQETILSILKEGQKISKLSCWIGNELIGFSRKATRCSLITLPYFINQTPIGCFAVLGPMRMPYSKIMTTLQYFGELISESITKSTYKFKISFKSSLDNTDMLRKKEKSILLEHKMKDKNDKRNTR